MGAFWVYFLDVLLIAANGFFAASNYTAGHYVLFGVHVGVVGFILGCMAALMLFGLKARATD